MKISRQDHKTWPLVIYHHPCYDGFTAAWIAAKAHGGFIEFWPAQYSDPPPLDTVKDRDVLIFDFSYPRETMIEINKLAASLQVFDHHATAQRHCAGLGFCTFESDKCGAVMAWELFYPTSDVPEWILRVQDRDLWTGIYQDTPDVRAYLESFPFTRMAWDAIDKKPILKMVEYGQQIDRYKRQEVKTLAGHGRVVDIANVGAVATVGTGLHISEVCHELLERHPVVMCAIAYFRIDTGEWVHSIRTSENREFDCSLFAERFGGGGHKLAAGFTANELMV